jgi:lipid II:glycine glycyltransferase (peptidoglycan interpeptide bridge formation enzyme)
MYSQQGSGIKLRIIVSTDKDCNILGGIAFGSNSKMGIRLVVPPQYTQYWGILISHRKTKYQFKDIKYRKDILESLINTLEQDHKIIDLALPPEIDDVRALLWKNYQPDIRYTFQKELSNHDNILSSFDPDIKRQIKKAENKHIKVAKGNDESFIKQFYSLQTLSLTRQKRKFNLNSDEFVFLINSLKKNKITVKFYLAYHSETPVNSSAILVFKNSAYYWLAGTNPEYFNTGANQLVMWNVMKDLVDNNIHNFDFVGANTPGVSEYKATYNARLVPYFKMHKYIGIYPNLMMKLKKTFF